MLAIGVGILISIDVIILVIYTIVEFSRGNFNAVLKSNEENFITFFGVRQCICICICFSNESFIYEMNSVIFSLQKLFFSTNFIFVTQRVVILLWAFFMATRLYCKL